MAMINMYLKIDGTDQGTLQSGGDDPWKIPIHSFGESAQSPRDAASGMATGRRMHQPFAIIKEHDSASPAIARAAGSNELLRSVQIVYQDSLTGLLHAIQLTNARVIGVRPYLGPAMDQLLRQMEELTLDYENITVNGTPSPSLLQLVSNPLTR